jgi:hypothetical protein
MMPDRKRSPAGRAAASRASLLVITIVQAKLGVTSTDHLPWPLAPVQIGAVPLANILRCAGSRALFPR